MWLRKKACRATVVEPQQSWTKPIAKGSGEGIAVTIFVDPATFLDKRRNHAFDPLKSLPTRCRKPSINQCYGGFPREKSISRRSHNLCVICIHWQ
jgi:hypothetical protein